jgi:hypothetical protein
MLEQQREGVIARQLAACAVILVPPKHRLAVATRLDSAARLR